MILDGLAAAVFLFKGEFSSFIKVLSAHLKFYGALPRLIRKRRVIFQSKAISTVMLLTDRSILWDYFILKRRKYAETSNQNN
jgi:hypothetical protein